MVTTDATRCPTSRLAFVLDEKTRTDFSPAKRYGELAFVFGANEEDKPSIWSTTYYDEAISRMASRDFDPDLDYVVATGAQVPLLLLVATLVAKFGQVNLLLFDSTASEYVHKRVAVEN